MTFMKRRIRTFVRNFGYDIVSYKKDHDRPFPSDFSEDDIRIVQEVKPYTLTSRERIYSLLRAVDHVEAHQIPGAFVECGVWRGGSMLAAVREWQRVGRSEREVYLFDTYEGMPAPTDNDVSALGLDARSTFEETKIHDQSSDWCYASLEDVQQVLQSSGYGPDKLHFIKGRVEDTIPAQAPDTIALLRLDTDWYESTKHELIHLFPRLSHGGILIIDDYGYWKGARKAVDEYLAENRIRLFLSRIDHTGRLAVKS